MWVDLVVTGHSHNRTRRLQLQVVAAQVVAAQVVAALDDEAGRVRAALTRALHADPLPLQKQNVLLG